MTVGIIAEYNPFHNGHIYHLNKIKEKYPDSKVILVMSGNVTQRGDISIINKWDKAEIALKYGVDLVVEIPFIYATQSADIFAKGTIEILNELKVDVIVFGSELNNKELLIKLAQMQLSDKYNNILKKYIDKFSYPKACGCALKELTNIEISTPNDLLGLSYIKEIIKNNYPIKIETIKRTNDYNSKKLEIIASATSIREAIKNNIDIKNFVPIESFNKIDNSLFLNNYFPFLKYKILTNDLTNIHGIDDNLAPRLKKGILNSNTIEELIKNIKSKKYSYNRIKRILIYLLFDIKKDDFKDQNYIRILGFNNKGKKYLSSIKKDIMLPLITNYSNSNGLIDIDIKINNILSLIKPLEKQNEYMKKEVKEVIRQIDITE